MKELNTVYLVAYRGTKRGDVSRYKVGFTSDIRERLRQLNKEAPFPAKIVHTVRYRNASELEAALKFLFVGNKVNRSHYHGRSEFFDLTPRQVNQFVWLMINPSLTIACRNFCKQDLQFVNKQHQYTKWFAYRQGKARNRWIGFLVSHVKYPIKSLCECGFQRLRNT